ncbi:alpha-N-methyltransferase NTM1 [Talaromyces proteolyticus]|uniref:Alpha N-terminal protein methyltransferase 1 n=1 Tax=Talaromyces proteolyticus TaxID=1131652 RepID=A0AAD4KZL7_9EURO|nr:alpha-N-methyltransferase NTM1 [Talaromyces proteolyticus]KAH8700184.1 alpha-N-methyltransferase NTM1 [Talaromyces proteolyticus]
MSDIATPEPPPDSHIDHASSIQYWNNTPPTVDGMLGGFPQISAIDLRGSASFLAKVRRLILRQTARGKLEKISLGVDCGAGIGRVTEGFLGNVCEVVDIVEPIEKFAQALRDGPFAKKNNGVVGDIYITGLENWVPEKQYDLIWNQWCVGHLTDVQLVEYLKRAADALTDSGLIILKENLSTDVDGNDHFDSVDSAVTRADGKFRNIFKEAGLNLIKTEEQLGFPKSLGLLPVRFYALRPEQLKS